MFNGVVATLPACKPFGDIELYIVLYRNMYDKLRLNERLGQRLNRSASYIL